MKAFLTEDCFQNLSHDGYRISWNVNKRSVDTEDVLSLPVYLEQNSDEIRALYLKWVEDFQECQFRRNNYDNSADREAAYQIWSQNRILQKFNLHPKSRVNNVIKLVALSKLILEKNITLLDVHISDRRLVKSIRHMCENLGVKCTGPGVATINGDRFYTQEVFAVARAFSYVLYYILRYYYIIHRRVNCNLVDGHSFVIFDILPEIKDAEKYSDYIESKYWGSLSKLFLKNKIRPNWVHLYYKSPMGPSPRQAELNIKALNRLKGAGNAHHLLESFISIGSVYHAIRIYFKEAVFNLSRRGVHAKKITVLGVDPILELRAEYIDSIMGLEYIKNALRYYLLEGFIRDYVGNRTGLYIMENQPWEQSLVFHWRRFQTRSIIGVCHSTVRFWDLRYHFIGKNSNVQEFVHRWHRPDKIISNGQLCTRELRSGGERSDIVELEALRYTNVQALSSTRGRPPGRERSCRRILVCGEFDTEKNQMLLENLVRTCKPLSPNVELVYLKHPTERNTNFKDHIMSSLRVSARSLHDELLDCDVAVMFSTTSACIDSLIMGVPIVQFLNPDGLNTNPLRAVSGIYTSLLGQDAQTWVTERSLVAPTVSKLLSLDVELPRWNAFIKTELGCR